MPPTLSGTTPQADAHRRSIRANIAVAIIFGRGLLWIGQAAFTPWGGVKRAGDHSGRVDDRYVAPDAARHRTRASAAGAHFVLLVVNLSHGGLMARCDAALAPGDAMQVELPVVGTVAAEVRLALAGWIGCRFDTALIPADCRRLRTLVAA